MQSADCPAGANAEGDVMNIVIVVLILLCMGLYWLRDSKQDLRELLTAFIKVVRALPQFYVEQLHRVVEFCQEMGEEPAEKVKRDELGVWRMTGSEGINLIEPPPPLFNALSHERCIPTPLYVIADDAKMMILDDPYVSYPSAIEMADALKIVAGWDLSHIQLKSSPWVEDDLLSQHLKAGKDEADEG